MALQNQSKYFTASLEISLSVTFVKEYIQKFCIVWIIWMDNAGAHFVQVLVNFAAFGLIQIIVMISHNGFKFILEFPK